MRAGKLRRRLELQRPDETRGANGEVVTVWAHQAWIWGEFVDNSGAADRLAADQRTAVQLRTLRIRKRDDVNPKSRIIEGRNAYEVVGVADGDKNDETLLTLKAVETATRG